MVPLLVLLPLIESHGGLADATPGSLLQLLGPTALESAAGLGLLLLIGRVVLRKIFEVRGRAAVEMAGLCAAESILVAVKATTTLPHHPRARRLPCIGCLHEQKTTR